MSKDFLLEEENEELKIAFVLGAAIYDELTEEQTKPISMEAARTLNTESIDAFLYYTFIEEFDFITDKIAFESVMNCCKVLNEREPIEKTAEQSWREFKERYSEFFEDV